MPELYDVRCKSIISRAACKSCLIISCCAASSGALATTNSDTAVLVLALPTSVPVSLSDVSAVLQGGISGTVTDVQPFPDQSSSYLIEVPTPVHALWKGLQYLTLLLLQKFR